MEVDNKSEQRVKQELQDGSCSDLEVRGRKIGDQCSGFEYKVHIADSNGETLEARYMALEVERMKIEYELELLKKENTELKERICNLENERNERHEKKNANEQILVDLTEPNEDEELAMVNMVLQVEKQSAEKNAAMWKQKYEELSMKMGDTGGHEHEGVRLMVDLSSFSGPPDDQTPNLPNAGTPLPNESKQNYKDEGANRSLETTVRSNRRAKKQLLFEDNNGIAPQTPSVCKCVGIIDISDSDDDLDPGRAIEHDEKDGNEEMTISFTPTSKRKRPSKVVNSDTESDDDNDDDDDNLPISTLKKPRHSESPENKVEDSQTPVRRRIRTLREVGETSRGIPTTKDTDDDDSQSEDAGSVSDSEGDSLGGFIVNDAVDDNDNDNDNDFDNDDVEGDNDDGVSNDDGGGDITFEEIISRIRRSKDWNWDWKLEGDMNAAIGKDPVLCMKAVCAIYRQQTEDEKLSKEARYANGRGFSKFDAKMGCQLGEFLTCGDPEGDLKVSVQQLRQYDAKGVDICRNLALRYSKQLFLIFQGGEDRFFRCSEAEDGA